MSLSKEPNDAGSSGMRLSANTEMAQRLSMERAKALQTLRVAAQVKQRPTQGKENNKPEGMLNSTAAHNATDYVLSQHPFSLDISDLCTNKSIDIELSSECKVSFNPSEMTGRSTTHKDLTKTQTQRTLKPLRSLNDSTRMSVGEILAGSFTAKARGFAELLQQPSQAVSSTLSSLSSSRSLPRTADMSNRLSNMLMSLESDCWQTNGFSLGSEQQHVSLADEEFAPAEKCQSKFLLDEIEWAQHEAAIPEALMSEEAKQKAKSLANPVSQAFNGTVSNDNSTITDNKEEMSMGSFFKCRSDQLRTIVPAETPKKQHQPYALIESGSESTTCPDSGNASQSNLFSLTAIAKMLQIELDKNVSGDGLLKDPAADKSKSRNRSRSPSPNFVGTYTAKTPKATASHMPEITSPTADTLLFTDSVLNSTERSFNNWSKSPVAQTSATSVPVQVIKSDDEGEKADLDEYDSPVKTSFRRVRRTKSPNMPKQAATPNAQQEQAFMTTTNALPKSLCSTKIEHISTLVDITEPDVTTNELKPLTPTSLGNNSVCSSPIFSFAQSPNTSPLSCNYSQVGSGSPVSGCRSPNMDSTSSTDRRFLMVGGACGVQRTTSSLSTQSEATTSLRGRSKLAMSSNACAAVRSASSCSNSSEFSHRDGKPLPLKVSCMELIWGSTRLHTEVRKVMQVKNASHQRLVLRVMANGPGFQIASTKSNLLTLQSQECRQIVVTFSPTVQGVAVGTLGFYPPPNANVSNVAFLTIPLYAYGGHASVHIEGALVSPTGSKFIDMGDLCELAQPLQRTLVINNKGPLPGFALVLLDAIDLNLRKYRDILEVRPDRILLEPGKKLAVNIVFSPSREYIKKIEKKRTNVHTLANLRIITGDEANRQRVRRLVNSMTAAERYKMLSHAMDEMWSEFPGEVAQTELEQFKETTAPIADLMSSMRIHEIAIVLNNHAADFTNDSSSLFHDADDTVLFRTVCAATSPQPQSALTAVTEHPLEGVEDDVVAALGDVNKPSSWTVQPKELTHHFGLVDNKHQPALLIRSFHNAAQHYEITCNYPGLLQFSQSEGCLEPNGLVVVEVSSKGAKAPVFEGTSKQLELTVRVGSEHIKVPIKCVEDEHHK